MKNTPPLIVIVGPTASGKTALAIDIARQYDGEVICADSRTVYRGMDIGTAKPDMVERQEVVHWGLDLVEPGQRFTAAAWQAYARERIDDIRSRGKLPIVAGGTGLYVDGLIFDYQYPAQPSAEQRELFESMSLEQLHKYCIDNNIILPENDKNKRHLVRRIVHDGQPNKRRQQIIDDAFVVGIATGVEQLRVKIAHRAEQMFADGVVEEAILLGKIYGWDSEAMSGNIYPLLRQHLAGKASIDEAKVAFATRDWQLAKRQMTWFRRNPYIAWGRADDCRQAVSQYLAS